MLVLTRKAGESIVIGSQIRVTVLEMQGRQIRLGIEAPSEIPVHRGEVYERIKQENEQAALAGADELKTLSAAWKKKKGR
ncbi:MAG: carbon storage regulator CsrA [Candidatus Latescibacterota bacterium]|nr:carbon storage regulator CsrA [Candidatus Latescibacterota bacterium]